MAVQPPTRNSAKGGGIAPLAAKRRPAADDTDYAHRDFINLAAAAFLLLIAIAIVWTVRALEDYEKLQRCLNSGRRDCVQIGAPVHPAIRMPGR